MSETIAPGSSVPEGGVSDPPTTRFAISTFSDLTRFETLLEYARHEIGNVYADVSNIINRAHAYAAWVWRDSPREIDKAIRMSALNEARKALSAKGVLDQYRILSLAEIFEKGMAFIPLPKSPQSGSEPSESP
jgi:hypothetical protein